MTESRNEPMSDLLPEELLWAAGGHASDVVLTAIADGQVAIVPPLVRAHLARCVACTTHLGNAALLSLHADKELLAMAKVDRALMTARQPLPRVAIALGLAVAALGLVPSFVSRTGPSFSPRDVPLFAQGAGTLARRLFEPGNEIRLAVTYGTAALLVAMGFALVRLLPKKETTR